MKKLVPTGKYLLVEPLVEEVSKGGIFLPKDRQKDHCSTGRVIAVGNGKYCSDRKAVIKPESKIGDEVVFNTFAGMECQLGNGTPVRIINEDDVLGRWN